MSTGVTRAIYPTPASMPVLNAYKPNDLVVAADPDIVVEGRNDFEIDSMADAILQDIGAVELSMMTRYDSLDGDAMVYSPIVSKSRQMPYSSNNLMGQPNSALTANGKSYLNSSHYVQGEINRGYQLDGEPDNLDMDIQIAVVADVVPFSVDGEVYEVI